MFQDYTAPAKTADQLNRLARLRAMISENNLAGFIIPRSDEHQGEYVPAHAERLAYITGFTGSAGMAIILQQEAALFVDGRYTLQASKQIALDLLTPVNSAEQSPTDWLATRLKSGDCLAYDPWLHTVKEIDQLTKAAKTAGASLVAHCNLVDAIWQDQPAPPKGKVRLHPLAFAGQSAADKLAAFQKSLDGMKADCFLLTQPDSIAWLFNIRGHDIAHTPVALAFALVPVNGRAQLFIDPDKIDTSVRHALSRHAELLLPATLLDHLARNGKKIALDPASTAMIFKSTIEQAGGQIIEGSDPATLAKACKNPTELAGARKAHLRDGVAMCRFLFWLSSQPNSQLSEISAARKLENYRRAAGESDHMPLCDISFDTISGFGPNGAIVHYRVTEETNRHFEDGTLYLVDSGGQYQDGTTDITRTVAIGTPSAEMKRHFTLVLKGMIAISRARFPKGTNGAQLDILARAALWQAGLDFDHGTGHGVGSYLSVHEGPQRLSKLAMTTLEQGMILSNEPGYYKAGAYGIRLENLIVVSPAEKIAGGERPMLGFETITFVPIDRTLIAPCLLDETERDWLNTYHQSVYDKISPRLSEEEASWLKQATAPLATR